MNARKWVVFLSALALVTVSCGGDTQITTTTGPGTTTTTTEPTAPQAEELRVAFPIPIPNLDPPAASGAENFPVISMMVESLTTFDQNGVLVASLATEWAGSEDGLTYTFVLREGVTFHDGQPFNAEAVKFSLDRLLSPDTVNVRRVTLAAIEEVIVVDDFTVDIRVSDPFGALPAALSLPNAGILSPASVSEAPNTLEHVTNPVGTGPYMLVEWVEGESLIVEANPNYWGNPPSYLRQVYQTIPEASSRVAMLRSGEVDVAYLPPASEFTALDDDPSIVVIRAPSSFVIQVWVDTVSTTVPQLQDPAVRKALSLAIDRQALIDQVIFGAGSPTESPIAPQVFGYCPVESFDYDPDLAREMLAEAGAEGMSLRMIAPTGRYIQDYTIAEAVAGYLRDVGLEVDLAPAMDFATYASVFFVPPEESVAEVKLIGWGSSYGDASQPLGAFLGSVIVPNGYNATYFANEEYDRLVAEGDAAADPADREAAYCTAQELLVGEQPSLWLYVQNQIVATTAEVEGIYGLHLWFVIKDARPVE